jgi:hypothetical protein
MLKRLFLCLFILSLPACQQWEQHAQAVEAKKIDSYRQSCINYGFASDAPELPQCMILMKQLDAIESNASLALLNNNNNFIKHGSGNSNNNLSLVTCTKAGSILNCFY